jgi:hypothetical protein
LKNAGPLLRALHIGSCFEKHGPKIRNQPSPIANLEHPFATSLINNFPTQDNAIDSAEGCSKLAIGEG